MRKKLLSFFCVLALCLGMLPVTALADDTLVATVESGGTTTYYYKGTDTGDGTHIYNDTAAAALQAAWSACAGKTATLTLKQNVELDQSLTVKSGAMTLRMDDGVALSSSVNQSIKITSSGSLDFRSGTINTTGSSAIYSNGSSGKVTLSGGNVISTNTAYGSSCIKMDYGEFHMTAGSVQMTGTNYVGYGVYIATWSKAYISGGEISVTKGYAVYVKGTNAAATLSGGTYSGGTSSISVSNGTVGDLLANGYAYFNSNNEKITDTSGMTLSSPVTVHLDNQVELEIVGHPENCGVWVGNSASFSVGATGSGLTYQWQVSEDGGQSWTNIDGATASQYSITDVTKDLDDNQYRCVVSDSAGNSKISTAATLTVYDYYTLKVQQGKITYPESTSAEVKIKEGEQVTIQANGTSTDQRFKEWTWTSTDALAFVGDTSKTSATATFTMPECDVTITATYEEIPKHTLTVVNGTDGGTISSGKYKEGAVIGIRATPPEGYKFKEWTWDTSKISVDELFSRGDSQYSQNSGIYMPSFDFTITATFELDNNDYTLTVDGGDGDGTYKVSTPVSITAPAKNDEGMPFWKWTSSNGGKFEDDQNYSTTFTMPASDVTVTAHYYDQVISINGYMTKDDFYAKLPDTVKLDDGTTVPVTWTCSNLDSKACVTEAGSYTLTAQYTGSSVPSEWPAEGIEYGVYVKQNMVQVWLGASNYTYDANVKTLTVPAGGETYELSFDEDITTYDGCDYVYLPVSALEQHTYEGKIGYRLYMTITGEGAENAYPVLRSTYGYKSEQDYEAGGAASMVTPQSYLSDAEPGASQYALLVTIDPYGTRCVTFDTSAPLAFEGAGDTYSMTFNGDTGNGSTYSMAAVDGSGTSFGNLGKAFFTVTPPTGETRAWAVLIVPSDEVTSGSSTGSGVTIDTSWKRQIVNNLDYGHNYAQYSLFQNGVGQFVAAYLADNTTAVVSEITLTADDQYAAKGEEVMLSVTADYQFKDLSGMPGVSYQWYECDADGSNSQAISGATGATYTTSFSELGIHHYYVEAKFNQFTETNGYSQAYGTLYSDYDPFGWASDTVTTSDVITLTVGRGVGLTATVNQNTFQAGETLTVNATVKPETGATGTSTGTVTLYMGDPAKDGKRLGSDTLSNGVATIDYVITQADVEAGPDQTLYIVYSGDGTYRSETMTEEIDLLGGLTITAVARDGAVIISWEKPQGYDNITEYKLYADKEGLATMPVNPIVIDKDATSYTVAHLQDGSPFENGTVYEFYLIADYVGGEIRSNTEKAMPNPVYAITVETDGHGTATSSPAGSAAEGSVVTLTAAPDSGYHFVRWEVVAGNITISNDSFTMPAEAVTVKAIFARNSSGGSTTYPVTVSDPSEHGTVTISPKNARPGSTVTITVTPEDGYELVSLTVTDNKGNEIEVTDKGNNKFTFIMPAGGATVKAVFRCTGSELCPSRHLTDVLLDAWYHEAVDYVVEHGIMTGTSATTFEPNTTLSRAMVAQILYNLEGQPAVEGESTFTDVNGHWAVDAITWAQETGVVSGYGDDTFRPNKAVTREELAQMLYNYAKYKGYDLSAQGDLTAFPDGDKVSNWAKTAMSWANGNKLINGFEDGTLRPGGDSTRAQAASILMNFNRNVIK